MADLSEHFSASEFRCKDGCDLFVIKPLLIDRLEQLRKRIGRPVPIVSGYRCCAHNAKVKGAARSRHTCGEAADIPASLHVTPHQAEAVGFTGIGTRGGVVVHVDVRPSRHVVRWTYD